MICETAFTLNARCAVVLAENAIATDLTDCPGNARFDTMSHACTASEYAKSFLRLLHFRRLSSIARAYC